MEQNQIKSLYRSRTNRIIFGVCGGLGEYFGIDPIIFRLIFIALTFGGGAGILLYIIMALLVPNEPLGGQSAETDSGAPDLKKQAEDLVSELKEKEGWHNRRTWIGIIIIIFGLLLLFNQLFPRHFFNWGVFWAAFIIALGIVVLRGKKRIYYENKNKNGDKNENQNENSQKETVREVHHHHYRRGGGVWRLFFGLLLLVLGAAFLIQNLNLVPGLNINFSYLWKFWPVLIIFWGLSVLSRGTWVGAVLSVIFALAIIGLIVFSFFWPMKTAEIKNYNFEIASDVNATTAEVIIKTGAAEVSIGGNSQVLASGNLESNIAQLLTSTKTENGVQKATIETEHNASVWAGNLLNKLQVNLSESIPLSLAVSSGASELDLDSTNLLLENFSLKSGASKLNLVFGSKVAQATADIDAGVSDINITLPKELGARLYTKTGLTSHNFADFTETAKNTFESSNYALSTSTIEISLEAGISNVSVTWR